MAAVHNQVSFIALGVHSRSLSFRHVTPVGLDWGRKGNCMYRLVHRIVSPSTAGFSMVGILGHVLQLPRILDGVLCRTGLQQLALTGKLAPRAHSSALLMLKDTGYSLHQVLSVPPWPHPSFHLLPLGSPQQYRWLSNVGHIPSLQPHERSGK